LIFFVNAPRWSGWGRLRVRTMDTDLFASNMFVVGGVLILFSEETSIVFKVEKVFVED
jgi:hypothetical protein